MKSNDKKSKQEVQLRFTCPKCGHDHLLECARGYVQRTVVKDVVCGPRDPEDNDLAGGKIPECEIRYASRADGSDVYSCVYDDYDVDSDNFYACAKCDAVLESESGSRVEYEEELAEWLLKNCPQDDAAAALRKKNDSE
jgi:hypothetical protein